MRFSYSVVHRLDGEAVVRPILIFQLVRQGVEVTVSGLLDSGADVNVLPYSVGIALGADWEKMKNPLRLSGNLANYEARGILLTASVADFRPVTLAFAWSRADHIPLVLGQINFFSEFDVCFFRSEEAFDLQPRSDRA